MNDAGGAQLREPACVDTDAGKQLAIVFTQSRCRVGDVAGCGRQAGHRAMHGDGAHLRVGNLGKNATCQHMRIVRQLRGVQYRSDGDQGGLEEGDCVGLGSGANEFGQNVIQGLPVQQAIAIGAKTRIRDQRDAPSSAE